VNLSLQHEKFLFVQSRRFRFDGGGARNGPETRDKVSLHRHVDGHAGRLAGEEEAGDNPQIARAGLPSQVVNDKGRWG